MIHLWSLGRDEHGQALIETAISLPLILVLALGAGVVIDALGTQIALERAASTAARTYALTRDPVLARHLAQANFEPRGRVTLVLDPEPAGVRGTLVTITAKTDRPAELVGIRITTLTAAVVARVE